MAILKCECEWERRKTVETFEWEKMAQNTHWGKAHEGTPRGNGCTAVCLPLFLPQLERQQSHIPMIVYWLCAPHRLATNARHWPTERDLIDHHRIRIHIGSRQRVSCPSWNRVMGSWNTVPLPTFVLQSQLHGPSWRGMLGSGGGGGGGVLVSGSIDVMSLLEKLVLEKEEGEWQRHGRTMAQSSWRGEGSKWWGAKSSWWRLWWFLRDDSAFLWRLILDADAADDVDVRYCCC